MKSTSNWRLVSCSPETIKWAKRLLNCSLSNWRSHQRRSCKSTPTTSRSRKLLNISPCQWARIKNSTQTTVILTSTKTQSLMIHKIILLVRMCYKIELHSSEIAKMSPSQIFSRGHPCKHLVTRKLTINSVASKTRSCTTPTNLPSNNSSSNLSNRVRV